MEENNNNNNQEYKVVNPKKSKKSDWSFGRNIALPFMCSALGTTLVIGTCFGVPAIRSKILGATSAVSSNSNSSKNDINTNMVSLANYSDTAVSVAQKVLPSIVSIEVDYSVNSYFGSGTSTASGSGVIISQDGYILTNNHIVNSTSSTASNYSYYQITQANDVRVYLYNDTTAYTGKIVGTDEQTDLAVIKIDASNLTAAELGSSSSVQVGEFAMAIGNPLGMKSSVASGIVSALNRKISDSNGYSYNLIQTDAAINCGNSGGALVNSKGQVIGINSMKMSGDGIESMGFAIPIDDCKPIYEQLISDGKVKRPYIGINGMNISEETAKARNIPVGAYIKEIQDFSPAQKAGLQIGDIIIAINGTTIKTMDELNAVKNKLNIGDEITLKVVRNNDQKDIKVTLGEQ